jgi:hypothetical protein
LGNFLEVLAMGRGSYLGGHTVIGPGSGWFSKTTKKKKKAKKKKKSLSNQASWMPDASQGSVQTQQAETAAYKGKLAKRQAHEARVAAAKAAKLKRRAAALMQAEELRRQRDADPAYQAQLAKTRLERAKRRSERKKLRAHRKASLSSVIVVKRQRGREIHLRTGLEVSKTKPFDQN